MLLDLAQYLWIMWLVFVLICVIIELLTLEFTFLMIAAGSLIGGVGANLLGLPWWAQIALAAVIAGSLLFTIRPLLLKRLRSGGDPTKSNIDALYGMRARATSDITDDGGFARLANGETWSARRAPDHEHTTIAEGARLVVTRVDGATVEVAPEERTETE